MITCSLKIVVNNIRLKPTATTSEHSCHVMDPAIYIYVIYDEFRQDVITYFSSSVAFATHYFKESNVEAPKHENANNFADNLIWC